jgi:hypothetical protein
MVKTPLTRALHYYESNATWTDEIGAKTKKIWAKQDYRDLVAINRRFQGVAEKIPETQETVLVKLVKLRVRSEKVLGMDLIAGI